MNFLFISHRIGVEKASSFRRSSYSLLKRQKAGVTKTGSRTLQISIIVFFRPDTIFAK